MPFVDLDTPIYWVNAQVMPDGKIGPLESDIGEFDPSMMSLVDWPTVAPTEAEVEIFKTMVAGIDDLCRVSEIEPPQWRLDQLVIVESENDDGRLPVVANGGLVIARAPTEVFMHRLAIAMANHVAYTLLAHHGEQPYFARQGQMESAHDGGSRFVAWYLGTCEEFTHFVIRYAASLAEGEMRASLVKADEEYMHWPEFLLIERILDNVPATASIVDYQLQTARQYRALARDHMLGTREFLAMLTAVKREWGRIAEVVAYMNPSKPEDFVVAYACLGVKLELDEMGLNLE